MKIETKLVHENGQYVHEGEAIYLWLRLSDALQPRAYAIPWNLKLAEKLEKSVKTAMRGNSTVLVKKPFYRRSLEEWGELNLEIIPPPLPPLKRPPLPPQIFNPREERV